MSQCRPWYVFGSQTRFLSPDLTPLPAKEEWIFTEKRRNGESLEQKIHFKSPFPRLNPLCLPILCNNQPYAEFNL